MKLGIVDLDTGNLASLLSALNKLNINFKICKNSFDFEDDNRFYFNQQRFNEKNQ